MFVEVVHQLNQSPQYRICRVKEILEDSALRDWDPIKNPLYVEVAEFVEEIATYAQDRYFGFLCGSNKMAPRMRIRDDYLRVEANTATMQPMPEWRFTEEFSLLKIAQTRQELVTIRGRVFKEHGKLELLVHGVRLGTEAKAEISSCFSAYVMSPSA